MDIQVSIHLPKPSQKSPLTSQKALIHIEFHGGSFPMSPRRADAAPGNSPCLYFLCSGRGESTQRFITTLQAQG